LRSLDTSKKENNESMEGLKKGLREGRKPELV